MLMMNFESSQRHPRDRVVHEIVMREPDLVFIHRLAVIRGEDDQRILGQSQRVIVIEESADFPVAVCDLFVMALDVSASVVHPGNQLLAQSSLRMEGDRGPVAAAVEAHHQGDEKDAEQCRNVAAAVGARLPERGVGSQGGRPRRVGKLNHGLTPR